MCIDRRKVGLPQWENDMNKDNISIHVPIDLNAFMFDEYAVPTALYHIGDEIATDLSQALFIFNQRPDMPLVTFQPDNPLD